MKRFVVLMLIFLSCLSCNNEDTKISNTQILKEYFQGLNDYDFEKISKYLNDSIVTAEFEFKLSENKKEYYTLFQWDSVFKPEFKITEISEENDTMTAVVSKICDRIRFLHDSAIVYKIKTHISDDVINTIETFEYIKFDFEKWQARRDSLVTWIDSLHPEYSGFIYDQTIEGGNNYLKAIDLYQNR